jgi:two-component system, OmpR family, phosphate regulon response regulator OmpR
MNALSRILEGHFEHKLAPRILLVDDDHRISSLLAEFLNKNGCRVTTAESAIGARRKMSEIEFDLLILDVMLPGENGISLASSLRGKDDDVPILMLSALCETDKKIEGLKAGADDYVQKPFDPNELLLRVFNIVKRRAQSNIVASEQVEFGPFSFVIASRELKKDGKLVRLTDRERDILLHFTTVPGATVSRQKLIKNSANASERTIDVQINHLRHKIEQDPSRPKYLKTVRGKGYRLAFE